MNPERWLLEKHQGNLSHEPGLTSWILTLADYFNNKKINFVDIGALFGYFTLIASKAFNNSTTTSVEGNPNSAKYIQEAIDLNNLKNTYTDNAIIGTTSNKRSALANGFDFIETQNPQLRLLKITAKHHSRKIFAPKKNYILQPPTPHITELQEKPLSDFIKLDNYINIFKIDTEGHQAGFLPPATPALIENNVILLIEFDTIKKLKKYNTTNLQLCIPFLEKGYNLYWCNHRKPQQCAQKLETLSEDQEINSLGVLIPSCYL